LLCEGVDGGCLGPVPWVARTDLSEAAAAAAGGSAREAKEGRGTRDGGTDAPGRHAVPTTPLTGRKRPLPDRGYDHSDLSANTEADRGRGGGRNRGHVDADGAADVSVSERWARYLGRSGPQIETAQRIFQRLSSGSDELAQVQARPES
jgi:hypothetical protein